VPSQEIENEKLKIEKGGPCEERMPCRVISFNFQFSIFNLPPQEAAHA
jgi:hypothetical protein